MSFSDEIKQAVAEKTEERIDSYKQFVTDHLVEEFSNSMTEKVAIVMNKELKDYDINPLLFFNWIEKEGFVTEVIDSSSSEDSRRKVILV